MRSVTQLCLTLCNPTCCSPPGPSVHGILQKEPWSGVPFPPPGDLPDPGVAPASPEAPVWPGGFSTTAPPGKPCALYLTPGISQRLRKQGRPLAPLSRWGSRGSERWRDLPQVSQEDSQPALLVRKPELLACLPSTPHPAPSSPGSLGGAAWGPQESLPCCPQPLVKHLSGPHPCL